MIATFFMGLSCLALAQVYDPAMTLRSEILKESMLYNDHHHLLRRSKRGMKNFDVLMNRIESSKIPNDPLYQKQWYLKNDGSSGGAKGLDLNVQGAWKLGFTGRNVTVAILDDGIDYTHKDLYKNYYHEASYDYSSNDHYPYPRYTDDWFNSHGTRCAGEIAAAKDNGICGVGVAYNARIAGIRMLDQSVMTDIIEAKSLSHKPNLIDIYSVSWGPVDNGKIIDGPRIYTQIAMLNGINNGRHGKGSIYVWASGDGGIYDDCNCDGYTNSMWTISINSAIINGETAIYDESCSSTLASTFSNSGSRKSYFRDDSLHAKNRATGVATTDLYGRCTVHHSGTSASAPQAAGVFAITLESNPSLTWRDIQHLTVLTTDRNHLHDRSGTHLWKLNGAGLEFNHLFGFGVLNAEKMVKLAKLWKPLPERTYCMAGAFTRTIILQQRQRLVLKINTDSCKDTKHEVNYLEHVQSLLTVRGGIRGCLQIYLRSPLGTRSLILQKRPRDNSTKGFTRWPFMTTHFWAERAYKQWKLEINYDSTLDVEPIKIEEWILLIHGTKTSPYIYQDPTDASSKLSVAKNIHIHDFNDQHKYTSYLKNDNQKRVGDDPYSKI